MRPSSPLLLAFVIAACGGAEPVPVAAPRVTPVAPSVAPGGSALATTVAPPQQRAPERFSRDTPRSTASGTTFTVPAGWTLNAAERQQRLDGPEPGIAVAIVEAPADRADDAMAQAWSSFQPHFEYPLKLAQDGPGRRGWERSRNYEYGTAPQLPHRAFAVALRKGGALTMVLVYAESAAYERRRAQVNLVLDSLRPSGYVRESFQGKRAHPLDASRLERIVGFVDRARKAAGVPGLALALVQDDKIVFQGGFGVRELGKPGQVGADTLFMIGSCSKSLTTLLLAKLVEEGKFDWKTPVTSVYPPFKLGDAATTNDVQMRHLVCACTGLPRDGFEPMIEFSRASATTTIEQVAELQPTTKLGEAYQYSNIMAAVAGYVGGYALYPARELGAAYDEAMRTRVFAPLDMKRSTLEAVRARQTDHAAPHAESFAGETALVTTDLNQAVIPQRPSGGIWSSARDMAAYLRMELAEGTLPDGRRYLSPGNLDARREPQVAIGEDQTYGMGLIVERRYGTAVVQHGGATFGHRATMFFLPEHGVGGVLLANADAGQLLARPFQRKTLEVLFDGEEEAEEDFSSRLRQRSERLAKDRLRSTLPADPGASAKLARRYVHPTLGEITVTVNGRGTFFDFGELKTAVASSKDDSGAPSFRPADPGMPDFMEFVTAEREGKRALLLRDLQRENVFLEKP